MSREGGWEGEVCRMRQEPEVMVSVVVVTRATVVTFDGVPVVTEEMGRLSAVSRLEGVEHGDARPVQQVDGARQGSRQAMLVGVAVYLLVQSWTHTTQAFRVKILRSTVTTRERYRKRHTERGTRTQVLSSWHNQKDPQQRALSAGEQGGAHGQFE